MNRTAFKEALCGVRQREDQATYRSSLQAQASRRSTRSPLVRKETSNFEPNGDIDMASNRVKTDNGLLNIEAIEVYLLQNQYV